MKELLDALGKALIDFSLRRFVGLLILLIVLALGTVVYERSTNTLRLRRIEHLAAVADQLRRLDSARIGLDPALADVQSHLKAELRDAARTTPSSLLDTGLVLPSLTTAIKRFLSGSMIWMLLALGMAASGTREKERLEGIRPRPHKKTLTQTPEQLERLANQSGALGFALGIVSIFLPLRDEAWFLWLAYPGVMLIAGMGVVSIMELRPGRQSGGTNETPPAP